MQRLSPPGELGSPIEADPAAEISGAVRMTCLKSASPPRLLTSAKFLMFVTKVLKCMERM